MAAGMHRMGVVALVEAYRAGRVSVVAATEHYLERIARLDPAVGAFTHVDGGGARAAAKQSAARWDAGTARPLEGVPIAVKANIDVAGWPVTGGIGAFRNRVADNDAAVIGRLRDAGAILLGVLNMHEAALGATTDNPFFGRTHNPHKPGYTAGGSSGGSGAAVAAGLCAAAIGTDTLGSIRIPASYCGITGMKPTSGLVPNDGLMPLVERWDCIGPMARSVGDTGAVLAAMAPLAPAEPIARVALVSSVGQVAVDRSVLAAVGLCADLLSGLGIVVEERAVALDHHRVRLAGFVASALEAGARFGALMEQQPEGFSDRFCSYVAFARAVDPADRDAGDRAIAAAAAELRSVLAAVDAILLPTTPQPAFSHAMPAPANQADFTALANIAGLPALALPAGWSEDGLPVGVQLMGRPGSEAALLVLGQKLEAALNAWRPPVDFR